jgi:hypothetical protein
MRSIQREIVSAGMRSSATYVSFARKTQPDKTSSAVVGTGRRGDRIERRFVVVLTSAFGPVQAPPPSAVASGRWGGPVAEVMWATVRAPRHALPASAIEASSAVAATKLGGWSDPKQSPGGASGADGLFSYRLNDLLLVKDANVVELLPVCIDPRFRDGMGLAVGGHYAD